MSGSTIDNFGIAYEVAKHWLPPDEESADARTNILKAFSRPHVTDPKKQPRRLTVGWIVATADGGFHNLGAEPLRPLSNRIAPASSIEEVIGDEPIEQPTVIVKLAKASLSNRDFQPSFGDTLRINEAGKPCRNIDLAVVRKLTALDWRTKPSGKWFYAAKRALEAAKFGDTRPLERLSTPPFNDDPARVLEFAEGVGDDEINYAIGLLIRRREQ